MLGDQNNHSVTGRVISEKVQPARESAIARRRRRRHRRRRSRRRGIPCVAADNTERVS